MWAWRWCMIVLVSLFLSQSETFLTVVLEYVTCGRLTTFCVLIRRPSRS